MEKNDEISRALIAAADNNEREKDSGCGKCFLIVILYLLMMFATIVVYRLSGEAAAFIHIAFRAFQASATLRLSWLIQFVMNSYWHCLLWLRRVRCLLAMDESKFHHLAIWFSIVLLPLAGDYLNPD